MRTLVTIALAFVLSACLTVARLANFETTYSIEDRVFQANLAQELRKKYVVGVTTTGLHFETPSYAVPSKGIFGLGPEWQEKLVVTITIQPRRTVSYVGLLSDGKRVEPGTVRAHVVVMERQSPRFPWRVKEGDSSNPALEASILTTIQDVSIRGREV